MTTAVELAERGHQLAAWVNFDGTLDENSGSLTAGENVLIRASHNVSSCQYNGTGDYTITFTTEMPDANYACVVTHEKETAAGQSTVIARSTNLAESVKILTKAYNTGAVNPENVSVAIFR